MGRGAGDRRHRRRKDGRHTAHVARQYLGSVGKTDNGIVAVTSLWADGRCYWPLHAVSYMRRRGCQGARPIRGFGPSPSWPRSWSPPPKRPRSRSLVTYTPPGTNLVVPLLQIVPSEQDIERLLLVSPESFLDPPLIGAFFTE